MSVNTVGSFHDFIHKLTLTCVLPTQVHFLHQLQFSPTLFEQLIPLWKTDMESISFPRIYRMCSLCFRQTKQHLLFNDNTCVYIYCGKQLPESRFTVFYFRSVAIVVSSGSCFVVFPFCGSFCIGAGGTK